MKSLREAASAFSDVLIARRVAARAMAAAKKLHRFLTEPGLHELDIQTDSGYGATVQIHVNDTDVVKRHPGLGGHHATIMVDADMYDRDLLRDAEDDLLAAAGRALGGRARWIEGDWGRGPGGTKSRSFGVI